MPYFMNFALCGYDYWYASGARTEWRLRQLCGHFAHVDAIAPDVADAETARLIDWLKAHRSHQFKD